MQTPWRPLCFARPLFSFCSSSSLISPNDLDRAVVEAIGKPSVSVEVTFPRESAFRVFKLLLKPGAKPVWNTVKSKPSMFLLILLPFRTYGVVKSSCWDPCETLLSRAWRRNEVTSFSRRGTGASSMLKAESSSLPEDVSSLLSTSLIDSSTRLPGSDSISSSFIWLYFPLFRRWYSAVFPPLLGAGMRWAAVWLSWLESVLKLLASVTSSFSYRNKNNNARHAY